MEDKKKAAAVASKVETNFKLSAETSKMTPAAFVKLKPTNCMLTVVQKHDFANLMPPKDAWEVVNIFPFSVSCAAASICIYTLQLQRKLVTHYKGFIVSDALSKRH